MTYHIVAISISTTYPEINVKGTLADAKAAAEARYDDGFRDVEIDIYDADYRRCASKRVTESAWS